MRVDVPNLPQHMEGNFDVEIPAKIVVRTKLDPKAPSWIRVPPVSQSEDPTREFESLTKSTGIVEPTAKRAKIQQTSDEHHSLPPGYQWQHDQKTKQRQAMRIEPSAELPGRKGAMQQTLLDPGADTPVLPGEHMGPLPPLRVPSQVINIRSREVDQKPGSTDETSASASKQEAQADTPDRRMQLEESQATEPQPR